MAISRRPPARHCSGQLTSVPAPPPPSVPPRISAERSRFPSLRNGASANPRTSLPFPLFGHPSRPAPPPFRFPPRNIPPSLPQRLRQHSRQPESSLLGKPVPPSVTSFSQHPPLIDEDGFQLVVSRNSKRRLRQNSSFCSFRIEAKLFTLTLKHSDRGLLLQISERRPAQMRAVLLPVAANAWLQEVLQTSIQRRSFTGPQWLQSGKPLLKATVSTNDRGQYLRLTSFLPAGHASTICIPSGRNGQGWAMFLRYISAHPQFQITKPNLITPEDLHKPLRLSPNQSPPLQQSRPPMPVQQWQPADANALNNSTDASETANRDWALAIIVDSDELPSNLQETSTLIAKKCNLSYLPVLTIFGENRALFFLQKYGRFNQGLYGCHPKDGEFIYIP